MILNASCASPMAVAIEMAHPESPIMWKLTRSCLGSTDKRIGTTVHSWDLKRVQTRQKEDQIHLGRVYDPLKKIYWLILVSSSQVRNETKGPNDDSLLLTDSFLVRLVNQCPVYSSPMTDTWQKRLHGIDTAASSARFYAVYVAEAATMTERA
jgi:hypothetical protein